MQVYSSLSGIPFYAPSAGYAPTNSADVSAIASAYQVVSSTATQLYAGTAYVTSINEAPVSAARAGNAANASLANSAWYDGTGRLISSLPDSATVSAIASSYVESGVSSKQDTLSFAYNTADQISSINGSALGGMDEAAVSGIASAYAESAVSSKADISSLSSYALSADVSGTVDLVSTQSANWGGSALALSAGPGVKFEKSGNTLVASTDETLLWSGFENASGNVHSLSESMSNFERLKFVVSVHSASFQRASQVTEYDITNNTSTTTYFYPECRTIAANTLTANVLYLSSDSKSKWNLIGGLRYVNTALTTGVGAYDFYVNKIIGVNRTAEV